MKKLLSLICSLFIFSSVYTQDWKNSFQAGSKDNSGKYLGGSEVMQMVTHKGSIYATVGYWEDSRNPWYGGKANERAWAQVIRLDSKDGKWQEDFYLGQYHLRIQIIKQLVFTKGVGGEILSTPDTLLVIATNAPASRTETVAKTYTRNKVGSWTQSFIHKRPSNDAHNYHVRDIQVFKDPVSGIEKVYAAVGKKGLFEGQYDPNIPGKIKWNPMPVFQGFETRPLGISIANGSLFLSSGNKIYQRINGKSNKFIVAHSLADLSKDIMPAVGGIRGLTTIPISDNKEGLIFMWCPNGKSQGEVYRLVPNGKNKFKRVKEINMAKSMGDFIGYKVYYHLGAYNEFYAYHNEKTKTSNYLVGMEGYIGIKNKYNFNGYYKGAVFAIRDAEGNYSLKEVAPGNKRDLVAVRCYVKSPFKDDNSIYFGGFDANSFRSTNKAWVYSVSIDYLSK